MKINFKKYITENKLYFNLLSESIKSLDSIKQEIINIINYSSSYMEAIKQLNNLGIKIEGDRVIGDKWTKSFYKYLSGGERGEDDPKINKELENIANQLQKFPNIKLASLDVTNPWYNFFIPENTKNKNEGQLHIKISTEKIHSEIIEIAKFINDNPKYFYQFKFSYYGNSFKARRDNFVIYLTKLGNDHIDDIKNYLNNISITAVSGKSYFIEKTNTNISHTESIAIRLAEKLLKLPGSPLREPIWKDTQKEFLNNYSKEERTNIPSIPSKSGGSTLILTDESNNVLRFNITTSIGKNNIKTNDNRYYNDNQFTLIKENNNWYIQPMPSTSNATLLNYKQINQKTLLKTGDIISIGNPVTRVFKGSMKVSFSN